MNTKPIPAIVMLLAGFVACVAGMKGHMDVSDFMQMLLGVLILFYILGCVIKAIVDKNFVEAQKETTTDGDEPQQDETEIETEEESTEAEDEE